MKKIMMIMALIMGLAVPGYAKSSYSRDASTLPEAAQATISNNFKAKPSLIKKESTVGLFTEYEVILSDGSEITFDKNGNWKEIEMGAGLEVPKSIIPQGISNYVNQNFKGQKIISIEKDNNGFDVEITSGVEMKFDNSGKFVKYD